jgi:hypothetical protein
LKQARITESKLFRLNSSDIEKVSIR